ncbi:uncharacterized protein L3040_002323 [Drepanopeziza brunnea f. sp. 'multigermtubi']|uniref:DUF1337 domain protein n=1 Tax=Marssonina brunnea f. sp. multigermtubi (strain MB_m1) TaxID=1072389 RepID=K1Y485_MARBU|nr:DUF1337 domain protein [Drepanopeziza brunnea f. sp. 'multigermtubi' MB_m1]EKD19999.1 DUF1337 domain protein [Drepanopeziza brunnea f. sp. 'multigermtubi' MB_m1]KAJ5050440.1 hypothetical protein L3040_002323 [Drepanopeziza brunnea f. sp. 'multigermtubi']
MTKPEEASTLEGLPEPEPKPESKTELPVLRRMEVTGSDGESGQQGLVTRGEIPDSEADVEEEEEDAASPVESGVGGDVGDGGKAGGALLAEDPLVDDQEAVRTLRSSSPEPSPSRAGTLKAAVQEKEETFPVIDSLATPPVSTTAEAQPSQDMPSGTPGDSHLEDAVAVMSNNGGNLTQEISSSIETSGEKFVEELIEHRESQLQRVEIPPSSAEESADELETSGAKNVEQGRDVLMSNEPVSEQDTIDLIRVSSEGSYEDGTIDEKMGAASMPQVSLTASEEQAPKAQPSPERKVIVGDAEVHSATVTNQRPAEQEQNPDIPLLGNNTDEICDKEAHSLFSGQQSIASGLEEVQVPEIPSSGDTADDGADVKMLPLPLPDHPASPRKQKQEIGDSDTQSTESREEPVDVEMTTEIVPELPSTGKTVPLLIPDSDEDEDEQIVDDHSSQKKVLEGVIMPAVVQPSSDLNKKGASRATEVVSSLRKPDASPVKAPTTTSNSQLRTSGASFKAPSTTASPASSQTKHDDTKSPSPPQSSNDILLAELKAMKLASITARNASLAAEIVAKRAKLEEVTAELAHPAAETVRRHIKLLHDYNDIRDVGQGLVGMIADNRGVRIGELYEEFGVGLKD